MQRNRNEGFGGPERDALLCQEFAGNFSVYLELRQSASMRGLPEGCSKQGDDGCGGIGSWSVRHSVSGNCFV